MTKRLHRLPRLSLALGLSAWAGLASAQEVVAVLSSGQPAYRETYESVQAAFGGPIRTLALGEAIPGETKIVLAIGGKAATQRYPGRVTLIYAVTPGIAVERKTHDGTSIKIMMAPDSGRLLVKLKGLQPGLKKLAVLWSCPNVAKSAESVVKNGEAGGLTVSAERLEDAEDLPARLRWLKGKVDAIWLPPDPILINSRNFDIIKHFSYDNDIPFYAPTEGLAEQGATAAVSVSYQELGRTMASTAKAVLAGAHPAAEIFAERVQTTINRTAATEAELAIPAEAIKAADKVFP